LLGFRRGLRASFRINCYDLVRFVTASATSYFNGLLHLEVSSLTLRTVCKPVTNNRLFPLDRLQRQNESSSLRRNICSVTCLEVPRT